MGTVLSAIGSEIFQKYLSGNSSAGRFILLIIATYCLKSSGVFTIPSSVWLISTIMATNIKKATIVAMAAITGATVQSETQAMQVAMQDMAQEYGKSAIIIDINPFDGLIA